MNTRIRISMCVLALGTMGCVEKPVEDGGQADETGDGDGDGDGGFANAETQTAIDDLQLIIEGTGAYFQLEHPPGEREPVNTPLHRCPHPSASLSGGEAGFTPPIDLNCNEAPNKQCMPLAMGGGVGEYHDALWHNNAVWMGVGFEKTVPHAFHYNLITTNATEGYGACSFTARAIADLDDDGVFSTYERRATADEQGIHEDPMLYIENEGE